MKKIFSLILLFFFLNIVPYHTGLLQTNIAQAKKKRRYHQKRFRKKRCPLKNRSFCSFWKHCFYHKDGAACYRIAQKLKYSKNHRKARRFFRQGCLVSHLKSCLMWAKSSIKTHKKRLLKDAFLAYKKGCSLNSTEACYHFAHFYEKGKGTKKSLSRSLFYYKKGCKKLTNIKKNRSSIRDTKFILNRMNYFYSMKSCSNVGYFYTQGLGCKKNTRLGFLYFMEACRMGESSSCHNIALLYAKGNSGVKKSLKSSRFFYKKACQLGHALSCYKYGYDRVFSKVLQTNTYEGLQYFAKACRLGINSSCVYLGKLYLRGLNGHSNIKKSLGFFRIACKKNYTRGCRWLGKLYFLGRGVKKDLVRAHSYFASTCRKKDGKGCMWLGSFYQKGLIVRQSYRKAFRYYKQACKLYSAIGCNNLAMYYLKGYASRKSKRKAKSFFKIACLLKCQIACNNLQKLRHRQKNFVFAHPLKILNEITLCNQSNFKNCFKVARHYHRGGDIKKSYKQAQIYYKKACQGDHKLACFYAGDLYDSGLGGKQSYKKAFFFQQKACSLQYGISCYKTGQFYELGLGIKRDYKKARLFFKKACNLNIQKACKRLVLFQNP